MRQAVPRALLSPWWHIGLPAAKRQDQLNVLAARFPSITALLLPVTAMVHLVSLAMRPPQRGPPASGTAAASSTGAIDGGQWWQPWADAVSLVMRDVGLGRGELMLAVGKPLGMHDLVKVCARITELGGPAVGAGLRHLHGVNPTSVRHTEVCQFSVDVRTAVLAEVADVLCGCTVGLVRHPLHSACACIRWHSTCFVSRAHIDTCW